MAVVMIAGGIDLSVGAMLPLAGVVIASQINSGSPVLGNGAPLYAIAAVLLGGISMRGGSGSLIGMLLGAAILGVLANGLNVSGVGGSYQIVVVGGLLVLMVALDRLVPLHGSYDWLGWG